MGICGRTPLRKPGASRCSPVSASRPTLRLGSSRTESDACPARPRVASTKLYLAVARAVNQSSWAGPRAFMHSFDQRVGARDERRRNFEAERLRGLEVDDQLEPGRLQHRPTGLAALPSRHRRIKPPTSIQSTE